MIAFCSRFAGSLLLLMLTACGGGGDAPTPAPAPMATDAERLQAATATANSQPACTAVAPFYWEIGGASGPLASGSRELPGARVYRADTSVAIASATKWLYGAYVAERRGGLLTAEDVRFLTFRSGYSSFQGCLRGQTVDGCLASPAANGAFTAADEGVFFYNGGHMQKHASALGLGAMDNTALAAELVARLGADVGLSFNQPQPAGGGQSTGADYARFLRKVLNGTLRMGALLGSQAVCTNPLTCSGARYTPIPAGESWHYGLGHWIEDDPAIGDGAFSSPGAFGFYPWIDASRRWYGVLVRESALRNPAIESVACGRLIRRAWVTATPL